MGRGKNLFPGKRPKRKLGAAQLKKSLFFLFKDNPSKTFTLIHIYKKLHIENSKDSVMYAIGKLIDERKIKMTKHDGFKYKKPKKEQSSFSSKAHEGTVASIRSGAAYIICDQLSEDVYVPAKHLKGAIHGDTVEVEISSRKGRKPEGRVTQVIKRGRTSFVGTVYKINKQGYVTPHGKFSGLEIKLSSESLDDAKHGDIVAVDITDWPKAKNQSPFGIITQNLGKKGSHDIEMKTVLIDNGFPLEFPPEVLDEVSGIELKITEKELSKREDFREVLTLTIDPDDAKDFDDALSYKLMESGNIEIGIHIADVTHYLAPGTALDKEAYQRSTSVYLVDRVLPMLPEKLSNNLCSLVPNQDRYTFSATFEFDKEHQIVNQRFGRTVIHSDKRFTYSEAQEVIDKPVGEFAEALTIMNEVAASLRKQRYKEGSIAFESEEVRFKLDEAGNPIALYVKERKNTHLLVEDFMLLANRKVAEFIAKKSTSEIPFVYRVHDLPDFDKLSDLAVFAKEFDVSLDLQNPDRVKKGLEQLTKLVRKQPDLAFLESLAIRSMAKAEYSPDNIGHYGLAFEYYTHFTSPIRRYSDVLVHRILAKNLTADKRVKKADLEQQCQRISKQERKAMDSERESIKYFQAVYLSDHVGETYEGRISGVIDMGLFVELIANKCEGMIRFDTFNESFSISDGKTKMVGSKSGITFRMGQIIKVRVLDVDVIRRQVELEMIE